MNNSEVTINRLNNSRFVYFIIHFFVLLEAKTRISKCSSNAFCSFVDEAREKCKHELAATISAAIEK